MLIYTNTSRPAVIGDHVSANGRPAILRGIVGPGRILGGARITVEYLNKTREFLGALAIGARWTS